MYFKNKWDEEVRMNLLNTVKKLKLKKKKLC